MKDIKINNLINKNARIDVFLSGELNVSRSYILKKIKNKEILLNKKIVLKPGTLVNNNDYIQLIEQSEKKEKIKNYDHKLNILYEDEWIMIVNKESGLLTHPTNFNEKETLMNAIKLYFEKKNIMFDEDSRYGIIHRLDRDTSGLILVAKNNEIKEKLINDFKENKICREYFALIKGHLTHNKVEVDVPIKRSAKNINKMITSLDFDAKNAVTIFEKIDEYDTFSLVNCKLKTGRTHQIRVHAKYLKNNIINDPLYGINDSFTKYGQYLHAYKLEFIHPISNKKILIETDLPNEFLKFIKERNNV